MEDTERTLVILLTMHRSGSSLTSGTFQAHGMSLGPWELYGAHPSNPHGHFEAVPILELSGAVQMMVHGFQDDIPETAESMAKFVASEGQWHGQAEVPEEYVERGRALIRALLDSGPISGFKDPRTVLLWPYWQRVLSAFPGVRVVPVALLRSPHEIAMSLFTRRGGDFGYWVCLDVVAVHLRRLQAIVEGWSELVPRVRFGGFDYFDDLEKALRVCGLEWNAEQALRIFDGTCVHHVPAVVNHRAQQVYDALCGAGPRGPETEQNATQLEADGRARDDLQSGRLRHAKEVGGHLTRALEQTQERLNQAAEQSLLTIGQLDRVREELRTESQALQQAKDDLRLAKDDLRLAKDDLRLARDDLRLAEDRLRLREEQLDESRREGHQGWLAYEDLRKRLERIETHPVLGAALKGRRELRQVIDRIKERLKAG